MLHIEVLMFLFIVQDVWAISIDVERRNRFVLLPLTMSVIWLTNDLHYLAFFLLLTAVNILNLVMFRVSSISAQSSAACLGQAVTMIMSQRIILGLHDWRTAVSPSGNTRPDAYELSNKGRGTGAHVLGSSPGLSSGYTPNSSAPLKSFVPEMRSSVGGDPENVVHVHVHQDVKEDYDSMFANSPGYPAHSVRFSFFCSAIGSVDFY